MNYVLSEEEYERLKLFGNAASQKRIEAYHKQVDDAAYAMIQGMFRIMNRFNLASSMDGVAGESMRNLFEKFQEDAKPLPDVACAIIKDSCISTRTEVGSRQNKLRGGAVGSA